MSGVALQASAIGGSGMPRHPQGRPGETQGTSRVAGRRPGALRTEVDHEGFVQGGFVSIRRDRPPWWRGQAAERPDEVRRHAFLGSAHHAPLIVLAFVPGRGRRAPPGEPLEPEQGRHQKLDGTQGHPGRRGQPFQGGGAREVPPGLPGIDLLGVHPGRPGQPLLAPAAQEPDEPHDQGGPLPHLPIGHPLRLGPFHRRLPGLPTHLCKALRHHTPEGRPSAPWRSLRSGPER